MRGIPNNPIPCEVCGKPGFPKIGRCNAHRPPNARLKYPFDPAKDAIIRTAWLEPRKDGRLTVAITKAARVIRYPRHIIRLRAQRLGITYDTRHKWTKWEEQFLYDNAGSMPIKTMQRHLGHGWAKIEAKIRSMGLRTAIRNGMTGSDVSAALGVAHQTVQRWERDGWLRRSSDGRFKDEVVLAFIGQHPKEYDLRRVDQDWFKAVLFPGAQCFYRPGQRRNEVKKKAPVDVEIFEEKFA